MCDDMVPTIASSRGPAGTSAAASQNVAVPKCPIGRAYDQSLEGRQLAAIEMITAGMPLGAVAVTVGVDRRTLYRWRQECGPFQRELNRRRRELWTGAADQLRGMLGPALDELNRQLHDRFDRTRFRAAATIVRVANLRKEAPVPDPDAEPTDG